jgi:VanZ family protein
MIPARSVVNGFRAALATATVAILYFSTTDNPGPIVAATNDKVQHILAFGAMSLLSDFSFPRARFGWAKFLALVGFGVLIEFIQYFLPWREASFFDVVADSVGIVAYWIGAPLMERIPLLKILAALRVQLAKA